MPELFERSCWLFQESHIVNAIDPLGNVVEFTFDENESVIGVLVAPFSATAQGIYDDRIVITAWQLTTA